MIKIGFSVFFSLCVSVLAVTAAQSQTSIAVTVNKGILTTYQLENRAKFLKLTGFKGNAVEEARKQLITEELQLQEGKRVSINLPRETVDAAYANLAKANRTDPKTFSNALRQRGVDPATLKRLIEARIVWQSFVQGRARAELAGVPAQLQRKKDITSILFNRGGREKNTKVDEYTIGKFIFIVPQDASDQVVRQRLAEVQTFRSTNKSCETATANAKNLVKSGVVTVPVKRFFETTLTPELRKTIETADGGLFTTPERVDSGYEFMAICSKREIVDNNAEKPVDPLSIDIGQLDTADLRAKSEKWLQELRDRATIDIRG